MPQDQVLARKLYGVCAGFNQGDLESRRQFKGPRRTRAWSGLAGQ